MWQSGWGQGLSLLMAVVGGVGICMVMLHSAGKGRGWPGAYLPGVHSFVLWWAAVIVGAHWCSSLLVMWHLHPACLWVSVSEVGLGSMTYLGSCSLVSTAGGGCQSWWSSTTGAGGCWKRQWLVDRCWLLFAVVVVVVVVVVMGTGGGWQQQLSSTGSGDGRWW